MSAWSLVRAIGVCAAATALVLGCGDASESGGGYGYAGGSGSSGSSGGGGGSTTPMLVDVDPNETMNAAPGEGVGVFVEYKTGGHWHIWWTCDTNKTGQSCAFDNTVTASTGAIANVQGGVLSGGPNAGGTPTLEDQTTTTTGIDEMTFDTPFTAGQTPIITLDAKVDGVESGQYLFFVQNGQINGGYKGLLTDPLELEPSTP
jgi:hypothetical protein